MRTLPIAEPVRATRRIQWSWTERIRDRRVCKSHEAIPPRHYQATHVLDSTGHGWTLHRGNAQGAPEGAP